MALKQVIVIRKDLGLKKGKLASQVAHAAVLASRKSAFREDWEKEGQKKVVVECENLEELLSLYQRSLAEKLPTALVEDAGLTQIEKGTKTCVGIGPAEETRIDKITGKLRLVS